MFSNEIETRERIVKLIYQKRLVIITIVVLAIIAAIIITSITPKRYKAEAIVYPPDSYTYDHVINNPQFGLEIDADKLIQVFESIEIRDQIIKEFDLIKAYHIDTSNPQWKYHLNQKYYSDISFQRTRYLSVLVSATTEDAELSAKIVNRLLELIDEQNEHIFKSNVKMIVDEYQKKYDEKIQTVNHLLDTIYALSASSNSSSNNKLHENRLKFLEERQRNTHVFPGDEAVKKLGSINKTQEIERLINNYYFQQDKLNWIRGKLEEAKNKLEWSTPRVYKISRAEAMHKKVSPKLSINLLAFVAFALVLSIMWILLTDSYKRFKQKV